jgi:hypothetical protein
VICCHYVRASQTKSQHEAGSKQLLLHMGFLLGLFFDPQDGGYIFLRNVGELSTDYTALYPRRQNSSEEFLFKINDKIKKGNKLALELKRG